MRGRKTSHENHRGMNYLRQLSPGMRVSTKYIKSTEDIFSKHRRKKVLGGKEKTKKKEKKKKKKKKKGKKEKKERRESHVINLINHLVYTFILTGEKRVGWGVGDGGGGRGEQTPQLCLLILLIS